MAIVTTRHATFYSGDAFVDVVEDDAFNPPRLIRIEGTNNTAFTLTVTTLRPNGQVWGTLIVLPGVPVSIAAGGPVRELSDLPRWRMDIG